MPYPRLKKWLRRVAWTCFAIVVVVLLAAVIVQTPWGKNAVVDLAAGVVSGKMDGSIDIGRVSGGFPFHTRIDTIRVSDAEGPWLEVDDFALDVRGGALWRKRVHIESIEAAQLTLLRRPMREEPAPLRIPNLPKLPEWLRVDTVAIPKVAIEEAVAGAPAALALEGHFLPPEDDAHWDIEFQLNRVDGEGTHALIDADVTADQLQLVVDVRDEVMLPEMLKSDGPVTFYLEGKGPRAAWEGALTARIADRDVVRGTLQLDARENTDITLRADAALDHPIMPAHIAERFGSHGELALQGTLMADGMLSLESLAVDTPQSSLHAAGSIHLRESRLDLDVTASHADPARLMQREPGSMPPAHVELSVEGSLDELDVALDSTLGESRIVHTSATLDISQGIHVVGDAQLWPHEAFVPQPVAERLGEGITAKFDLARNPEGRITIARLELNGAGAALRARGDLDPVSGVVDATVQATLEQLHAVLDNDELALDGAIEAKVAVQGDGTTTSIKGAVNARNLSFPDGALPGLDLTIDGAWEGGLDDIEDATASLHVESVEGTYQAKPIPALQLAAQLALPQRDVVVVKELTATDGHATLLVGGTYDTGRGETRMTVSLDAPLAPYHAWLGEQLVGNIRAAAEITKPSDGPWSIVLNGEAEQLKGVPRAAQALLGEHATVAARATMAESEITVESVDLQAAYVNASAHGAVNTDSKDIAIEASASIPDLQPVGKALNADLAGALQFNGHATGTIDAPSAEGTLSIADPALGPLRGHRANADFTYAASGDVPRVSIAAELEPHAHGLPLQVQGDLMLDDDRIHVPTIVVRQDKNRISGNMVYLTSSKRIDADLAIDAPNLASLAALTSVEVQGHATGTLTVSTEGAARAEFAVADLQWGDFVVQRADLNAAASQIYDAPEGELHAQLARVVTPGAIVSAAAITLRGNTALVNVSANAQGTLEHETSFTLQTIADLAVDDRRITVASLDGALGEYPIQLEGPATMAAVEEGWRVDALALRVGDGTVRAQGLVQPENVNLQAALEAIPLAILQLAGGPEVEGTARGELAVTGTGASPQGRLTLHLADVRRPGGQPDAPPADIHLTADLAPATLQAAVEIGAGDLLDARGNAVVPMTWQLTPWQFNIAEQAPLEGAIEAQGDLAALPAFLVLPEHKIEGRIDAQIALRGTRGAPELVGEAHLRDARYENVENGTILANLEADFRGENTTLQLERLEAVAGPDGAVSARGEVAFPRGEPLAVDATITLRNARVVHRDDATARVTGELRFHGTPAELWVEGDLQAGPADIALPEPSSAKVAELEVTEVNLPEARAQQLAEEAKDDRDPGIINLKFHVAAPGRVRVQGHGLDTEWRGDLTVTGTANEPRLDGTLGIVRGHISVLGRRFEFENSTIIFNGNEPPDPYLNLNAVADAGDITARLAMTGTLDTLVLELSSEPALPRDEILARVLFGKSVAQLTALQAVQLAHAAATLTGKVDGLPFLAGATRLSVVEGLELRQGESLEEAALGFGRYIGDEIYVEVEKGLGPDSGTARVEVELSPQISIEGEVGADRGQGIGLFWKRDY